MDIERQKAACLRRFMKAVRMGRNGDWSGCQTIVAHVRDTSGDEAAERTRRELFNYVRSDKAVKDEQTQVVDEGASNAVAYEAGKTVKRGSRTVRTR